MATNVKNYAKYVIAFAVVAAALGYFIVSSMSGEKLYYKDIAQLIEEADASNRGFRITGDVSYDNFSVSKFEQYAAFEISDDSGKVLSVVYNGSIPDAFEEGAQVILEGTYDKDANVFTAKKLLAKCPSKYESEGDEHPADVPKHPDEISKG